MSKENQQKQVEGGSPVLFHFATLFSLPLLTLFGLSLALYNRYPLIFHDSIFYFHVLKRHSLSVCRPVLYGPTMRALVGLHPWGWVIVQSALCSLVLLYIWRFHFLSSRCSSLMRVLLLSALIALTPLSFEASYLMPDFSTGLLLVAAGILLVWWHALTRPDRIVLLLVVLVSTSFHLSHFLLLGLLCCLGMVRFFLQRSRSLTATITLAVVLVLVVSTISIQNKLKRNTWRPSPTSGLFLFARFYSAGPVKAFLDNRCKSVETDTPYVTLCDAHRVLAPMQRLSAQWILWAKDSPMSPYSNYKTRDSAGANAVYDALVHAPLSFAAPFFKESLKQFQQTSVAEALGVPSLSDRQPSLLAKHKPILRSSFSEDQIEAFEKTRQNQGYFPYPLLNLVYSLEYWFGLFGLGLIVIFFRKRYRLLCDFYALMLLGIVGNAFICGGLSTVDGRYQLRVSWIPVTCVFLFVISAFVRRGSDLRHA